MKKITLLITFLCFGIFIYGQHTFPTDTNIYTVPDDVTIITVNVNDMANSASVPAGLYSSYSVTVDWSISSGNAWSNEARLAVGTNAGTTTRTSSPQGASSTASVQMTFTGDLAGIYDPSSDGTLFLELSRTFSSPADWTNISVTIFPAPTCGEPTDLLAFVNDTSTLFAWSAPVAGSPTGYNWEVQPDGVAQGTPGALASGTTTDTNVNSGMVLAASTSYEFYVQTDCGGDGTSTYSTIGFTTTANPTPVNDNPFGAVPLSPSPSGTGCASATFTLPFSTDGTTDSGVQGSCSTSGNDQYFTWTATTDGLLFNSTSPGDPGIVIWDANSLTEIDCSDTFETGFVLSGWTIGQDLIIQIYDFDGSSSDVAFCLELFTLPSAAPNCAETPISPADGATDVAVGTPVTVTWTAPSTGEVPTSYDLYFGNQSDGSDLALAGNVGTTFADVTFNLYSTTYYWQVIPKNSIGDATGCALWSFTTEATPPPPSNDDCSNAIALTPGGVFGDNPVTGQTNSQATDSGELPLPGCASYDPVDASGNGGDLWYAVMVPADGNLTIETDSDPTASGGDGGMAVYTGSCGALALLECNDDDGPGLYGQVIIEPIDGLANQTVYVRVWEFGGDSILNFQVSAYSATLSNDEFSQSQFSFYPNPTKDKLHFNSVENIDSIAVYNLLGQEVLRQVPNSVNPEVDMSNLRSGNYFVRVTIQNRTETIKIIKD